MLTPKRGKMKIEKQIVMKMDGIYAVNSIVVEKKRKLLIATEKQGECWQVDSDSLEMERVWRSGGTMAFAGTHMEKNFGQYKIFSRFLTQRMLLLQKLFDIKING